MFDHIKDFKYIYSSFMQVYNIDLIESDISFIKYSFLLDGLFKLNNNAVSKVVEIRQTKIPMQTSDNVEYVQSLFDLKALYKLDVEESEHKDPIKSLFNFSKKIAKGV